MAKVKGELIMRCLDQELHYGYEYTGCHGLSTISPHTDNYIVAVTQVCYELLSNRNCGNIITCRLCRLICLVTSVDQWGLGKYRQ